MSIPFKKYNQMDIDLSQDDLDQLDYDLHYCEVNPAYYCDVLYCEQSYFNFKCPYTNYKEVSNE